MSFSLKACQHLSISSSPTHQPHTLRLQQITPRLLQTKISSPFHFPRQIQRMAFQYLMGLWSGEGGFCWVWSGRVVICAMRGTNTHTRITTEHVPHSGTQHAFIPVSFLPLLLTARSPPCKIHPSPSHPSCYLPARFRSNHHGNKIINYFNYYH